MSVINSTRRLMPIFAVAAVSLVLFLSAVIGFVELADDVRDGETLEFDRSVLMAINGTSSPLLDYFFVNATHLGGFVAVPIFVLVAVILLWRTRGRLRAAIVLLSVAGAAVINLVLKLIFERQRPDLWEKLVIEPSFSFPSGHAMASAALALSLIVVLWTTKWRWLAGVLGIIYIVVIGYSRMYLGVHYPSDILAGWMVSLAWVLIVIGTSYWVAARLKKRRYDVAVPE